MFRSASNTCFYAALANEASKDDTLFHFTACCSVSENEYQPSYYKLEKEGTKICLATGFSRYNQHDHNNLFNVTQPVRVFNDSLLNQVALLSSSSEKQCDEGERPNEGSIGHVSKWETLNQNQSPINVSRDGFCHFKSFLSVSFSSMIAEGLIDS